MIQSMTGFAERRSDSKTLSVKFSVRSLNHRFLDWNYRGTQIGGVESQLRAILQKKFRRGRFEVFLEMIYLNPAAWELRINEDLLRKILSSVEKLSSRMKQRVSFSVDRVFNLPQVMELKRKSFTPEEVGFLENSFEKTLDDVLKMRKREGREIARDIRNTLDNIKQAVNWIERMARKQPFLIREKLKRRMKELSHESPLSEEKLVEEAAYLAQRYDLAEEVTRLKSHIDYALKLLSPKRMEPVGRKLDFVAQELFREVNTINSKSQDIEITKKALNIKGEVESIRQQVQNVE
ncbi:MAG: YicC/YloC family endoribonuclease [Candidatus Aminicenantes bacterium]